MCTTECPAPRCCFKAELLHFIRNVLNFTSQKCCSVKDRSVLRTPWLHLQKLYSPRTRKAYLGALTFTEMLNVGLGLVLASSEKLLDEHQPQQIAQNKSQILCIQRGWHHKWAEKCRLPTLWEKWARTALTQHLLISLCIVSSNNNSYYPLWWWESNTFGRCKQN